MPSAINPVSASVAALSSAAKNAAQQQPVTVVSNFSTTSITGKVTTITTFSDGTVKTTVSDGDTVILSATSGVAA